MPKKKDEKKGRKTPAKPAEEAMGTEVIEAPAVKNELPVRVGSVADLRHAFVEWKPMLERTMAPGLDPERLLRLTLIAARQQPKLADCDIPSIMLSLMESAALRLEPNGVLGLAYLIPYKAECKFQPGYRGLHDLVLRGPTFSAIGAQVVYERDDFDFAYGTEQFLRHRNFLGQPVTPGEPQEDAGLPRCVYSIAHPVLGPAAFEVMSISAVEAVRARSKMGQRKDSPWVTDWDPMAQKTTSKRLCWRRLRTEPAAQVAVALDDQAEIGSRLRMAQIAPELMGEAATAFAEEVSEEVATEEEHERAEEVKEAIRERTEEPVRYATDQQLVELRTLTEAHATDLQRGRIQDALDSRRADDVEAWIEELQG